MREKGEEEEELKDEGTNGGDGKIIVKIGYRSEGCGEEKGI